MQDDLNKIIKLIRKEKKLSDIIRSEILFEYQHKGTRFQIDSFTLGSQSPQAPVLFITGGVHGLERIGAQLAWSFLKTTVDRLLWDDSLQQTLEKIKIVIIPILNPSGYHYFTRANHNGVDLMRNAPVFSDTQVPFLLGGQKISKHIPWFKGNEAEMEPELLSLIKKFNDETQKSPCVVSVDFHSGFGIKDRLWFPYSHSKKQFENLSELHMLFHLFEQTYPYHIYQIEPQSAGYLLEGDIWDYLYLNRKNSDNQVFIPLTLEMGSWNWVRKNPIQLFRKDGIFNPIKEHRIKRTFRRHQILFEFLLRALYSNTSWSSLDDISFRKHNNLGIKRWYANT